MSLNFKEIFSIVSSIFITFTILPVSLIFVIFPLAIYRKIVIWLSSWNKELSGPLSLNDCAWAWDDVYNRPLAGIVFVIYLKGTHSFSDLVARIEKASGKDPKFTCSLTRWMNVPFWKKCDNFNLHNHIKLNTESDPAILAEFINSQVTKSFLAGQPLWECISLPNYTPAEHGTKSAIIIRIHHSIGDGLSMLSIIRELCDPDPAMDANVAQVLKSIRKKFELTTWQKICYFFQLIFVTPSETVYYMMKGLNSQKIPPPDSNPQKFGVGVTNTTARFDINLLKNISKKTGFSVTAVIQAGLAGALRELIVSRGGDLERDVVASYILPRLNHPGTMANNVFCFPLQSPINLEDRFRRLAWISKQFDHVLHSALPIGLMASATCFCLLLASFGVDIGISNGGTYAHSNVNLNLSNPLKMFGHVMETFDLLPGIMAAGNSLFITTISYNGKLIIQLTTDKAAFTDDIDLQRFLHNFQDELNTMMELKMN
ncbi:O-acyltransferase WSD [Folsomia candida]|uniref:O-acyltransferase WSD n=2 Tax=Folsomia candida TaxID=158441 RepID=A0A226DVS7_FOLCA|nr:O-acyltransferase WSD [Folsomia candida]